ncbi:hypothetical protein [Krasilnikovia sp. MM14-A1259]|uniref:hypothetical protein n=1 Tax=Krasilnikovia sp. MM14-A1259 TaxID=3373539 RepID=UPI003822A141
MFGWWRRDSEQQAEERRRESVVRALRAPPEPIETRGPRRWRGIAPEWHDWLRRSETGVEVCTRWQEADEYRFLLGDDAYRDQLLQVLARAAPRDCAAAGFGCTRRSDRRCRAPEICSQERGTVAGDEVRREGPLPGACDAFHGEWGRHLRLSVRFSAGERHRAVLWADSREPVTLWVDGRRVGERRPIDDYGWWVDDRFFVLQVEGPEEHPEQTGVVGALACKIKSVLVYDADRQVEHLFEPRDDQVWIDPVVERHGDELHVHPDAAHEAASPPDQVMRIT